MSSEETVVDAFIRICEAKYVSFDRSRPMDEGKPSFFDCCCVEKKKTIMFSKDLQLEALLSAAKKVVAAYPEVADGRHLGFSELIDGLELCVKAYETY